jgi:poly(hydroxyalkanoate) depolymerase family esterase
MRSISDTIARLSALRKAAEAVDGSAPSSRLRALDAFGSNPGALRGHIYIPPSLSDQAALVVVLHGCTQSAAAYDLGSGWSDMADRYGFALLYPEQQRQNNANLCFNWFSGEDNRRGTGEAESIRQMIAALVADHPIDPDRVFVTGLSAGGAMTAVMLATYPEIFAGGAIVAGLPYGCANTIPEAFDRMRGHGMPSASELAARVRKASPHTGRWPVVSIWHGTADATVSLSNADAIRGQWGLLHGTGTNPDRIETVDGQTRKVWCDGDGREVIEDFAIAGMGHGTPLGTTGVDACGKASAFMIEAGISSTRHICHFWGLDREQEQSVPRRSTATAHGRELVTATPSAATLNDRLVREGPASAAEAPRASGPEGVRKVIEDALRSAGLMR